ncbi:hypothetical protein [Aliiglaciecola litoralis]|uniref:PsiF repeat-containing protein n=1 Tax=Aliiglaciecola litoralis TaxID=582857 RepID=A0ABN1LEK9_9ALTE
MRKAIISLLVLLSTSAFAQQVADADTISEMLEYCKDVAAEDGTGNKSMDEFLLNCVNEELASEDFKKIKMLPKL